MRYRFLRFPDGRLKAVTFSYDDGVVADTRLARLLADRGLKGTFNINSGIWNREGRLTPQEIQENIVALGHEVAIHGEWHRALGVISTADGIRDVLRCREAMEQAFDRIVRGMAYPDSGITRFTGDHTYDDVKGYLQALGIIYARTLGGDNDRFDLPNDWHAWMPTAHHNNPEVMAYAERFCALTDRPGLPPRLFYLWGHSYEFDDKNNWEHMEALCDKLAGKEDIWYATNEEIYMYVKAYEALVFSADDTRVYNPTATDVWFNADGHIHCVKAGETTTL